MNALYNISLNKSMLTVSFKRWTRVVRSYAFIRHYYILCVSMFWRRLEQEALCFLTQKCEMHTYSCSLPVVCFGTPQVPRHIALYCIFARSHKQSIRFKDLACFITDIGMRQTRVKTVMVGKLIDKRLWSVWSAKNFWRLACKWMSCYRITYVRIFSHLIIGQRCCWSFSYQQNMYMLKTAKFQQPNLNL